MIWKKPGETDISGIKVSKNKFKPSLLSQVRQEHASPLPISGYNIIAIL